MTITAQIFLLFGAISLDIKNSVINIGTVAKKQIHHTFKISVMLKAVSNHIINDNSKPVKMDQVMAAAGKIATHR